MSGICGIVHFDGRPVDEHVIRQMAEKTSYRGPDGIGCWIKGNAGFAQLFHNLSGNPPDESQPLVFEEGRFMLCADARIDNRIELLSALKKDGFLHSERPTDRDLIMAAYRLWGTDCLSHLTGDYAFSMWDARSQLLFAARDPMAMRGLYYYSQGNTLIFASEIKQILTVPGVPRRVFEPAVGAYLVGPYTLPEWTLYEGILQLPPAHALSADQGRQRIWRFWEIDPGYEIRYRRDDDYGEHFLEILKESVRCRLSRSKKTGILLSGGVDSGAVTSIAGWLTKNEQKEDPLSIRTYSWAFRELDGCDERSISREIVRVYGLAHTDVEADQLWPLKDYPEHGPDQDDPYIDIYQPLQENTLSIARDQGVSTIITAERGDEMVGAWVYDLLGLLSAGRWGEVLQEMREHLRILGESVPDIIKNYLIKPWIRFRLTPEQIRRLKPFRTSLSIDVYPSWLDTERARRIDLEETIRKSHAQAWLKDDARNQRYGLLFSANSARRIRLEERTCARFGLGYCDPWSDVRLARFVLAIPQWRVHTLRQYKRLARTALRGIMPEKARRESCKTEPAALYERGIMDKSRGTIMDLVTDTRAERLGYLDEVGLQRHYSSVLKRESQRFDLWWPLTLEMWLRAHW